MTRQEFAEYMAAFEKRQDVRFDDLKRSMTIQFEDVRRELRFSLEAVVGLRETTERGFTDMRAEYGQQTGRT